MSYPEKWSKTYRPADMTVTKQGIAHHPPKADDKKHFDAEGNPLCFFNWAESSQNGAGWWWTPEIPISTLINDPNAFDFTLDGFSCERLAEWSGLTMHDVASLLVELDGSRIIDRELPHIQGLITIPLTANLTGMNVKFGLWQECGAGLGSWVQLHIWNYLVWGSYQTSTPPVPRTLTARVFTPQGPIAGATVELLSGLTRIASDITNGNGLVTFNAYNRLYTVKVWAVDHTPYPYIADVDLTAGDASIDIPLLFIGKGFELPWWVLPTAIGIGAFGGLLILRRAKEQPIIVVK